jgi:LuxR family transcriptional regulator, quorum-sensing system regulator SolR
VKLWQGDFISQMQLAQDEKALFDLIQREAQELGFEHSAYGLKLPLNMTKPKIVMFNNYSRHWQQRYIDENYLTIDPIVKHGGKSTIPVVWSNDEISGNSAFWEEARSHGLQYGWAQASTNTQGIRGLLTLTRSADPLSESELKKVGYRLVWLTQVAHQCMSDLISFRKLPETTISLSTREKDVLRWTAEGKTAGETARIMNISERTVNFHIANAMQKLNCVNKTVATVRAVILGILNL